jgi:hypothetical protein
MNKIWFVLIESEREGPWSKEELKVDQRLTPDTLIWKEGFDDWKKIRDVPELSDLFEEKPQENEIKEEPSIAKEVPAQDELVLDMRQEPPFRMWIYVALAIFIYVILKLYVN